MHSISLCDFNQPFIFAVMLWTHWVSSDTVVDECYLDTWISLKNFLTTLLLRNNEIKNHGQLYYY